MAYGDAADHRDPRRAEPPGSSRNVSPHRSDDGSRDAYEDVFKWDLDGANDFAAFEDSDTPSEVDAAFRIQRRIALWHFAIFLLALVGSIAVTTVGSWAVSSRIGDGMNLAFVVCGILLFVVFAIIGLSAATLGDGVDDRMLGADSLTGGEPRQ